LALLNLESLDLDKISEVDIRTNLDNLINNYQVHENLVGGVVHPQ
jgi:hypothetical protein